MTFLKRRPVLSSADIKTNHPEYSGPARSEQGSERTGWQLGALAVCFGLGLMLIALIQTMGDGIWFWYAQSLLHGKHLYADMHLALQPLYVLETAGFQRVFGTGWVVSHLSSVIHLCIYVPGFFLLVRPLRWPDWQKALLLLAAFIEAISFVAFRFDDYHVLTDSLVIYSIVLLLRLYEGMEWKSTLAVSALLGVLCGCAITTRINDGGLLLVAVGIALLGIQKRNRIVSVLTLGVVAAGTVVCIVSLTGDTFHDYLSFSLFHAAADKGGVGSVFLNPFKLPFQAVLLMKADWRSEVMGVVVLCACAIVVWLVRSGRDEQGAWIRKRVVAAAAGFLVLGVIGRMHFLTQSVQISVSFVLLYVLIGASIAAVVRFVMAACGHAPAHWTPLELLFFIPLGQLASGAMSSAGSFLGLYLPPALCLVLVPVIWPHLLGSRERRAAFLTACFFLILSGFSSKLYVPFYWHTYKAGTLRSTPREWYQHPVYGPMWIQKDTLGYMKQVCSIIDKDRGPQTALLSLPYPYANYFCAIEPWHGVVQTYYDTTGAGVIQKIMTDLNSAPPRWIMYQRQLKVVAAHERIFNHGAPLPHRALDTFIVGKVASGEWSIASHYGQNDTDWYLIDTHAGTPVLSVQ